MEKSQYKTQMRTHRHKRLRAKVSGTAARPRLAVYRSNAAVYAQLIDDESGKTLAAVDSRKEKKGTLVEKAKKVWMDGDFVDWDDANVHILTHTLHYGLGGFEGIRCYLCDDGRSAVFRLPEHVERLFHTAHSLMMKIPYSQEEITHAILDTLRVNEQKAAYIRPLVFIGDGAMGLHPQDNPVRVSVVTVPSSFSTSR